MLAMLVKRLMLGYSLLLSELLQFVTRTVVERTDSHKKSQVEMYGSDVELGSKSYYLPYSIILHGFMYMSVDTCHPSGCEQTKQRLISITAAPVTDTGVV